MRAETDLLIIPIGLGLLAAFMVLALGKALGTRPAYGAAIWAGFITFAVLMALIW